MSDFKNLQELMDYVHASPDNHVRYDYANDMGDSCDKHWNNGEMRYVNNDDIAFIGHYSSYIKLPKIKVDKTKEKARELIKIIRHRMSYINNHVQVAVCEFIISDIEKVFELEEK